MSTYIVLGNMRGGTSMVAGMLRILGVFMGDKIDEHNHEDLDLQHRHPLNLRSIVAERNASYKVWGWKDPLLIDVVHDLIDLCPLRDPVFIVVMRDAVATAQSLVLHEGWAFGFAFSHASSQSIKLFDFVHEHPSAVLVSYEKAMSDPAGFVDGMVGMLGLDVSEDLRDRAIAFVSPGYKAVP